MRSHVAWAVSLIVLAWLTMAIPAAAHALPVRANPPIDGTVTGSPPKVEVWFSQEVDPNQTKLVVIAPDGTEVDKGDTSIDLYDPHHAHVLVSLQPGLGPGRYTVQWHSRSIVDSDAVDGSFTFTIAGGGGSAKASGQSVSQAGANLQTAAPTSAAIPPPLPASSAAPVKTATSTAKSSTGSKSSSNRTIVIVVIVVVALVIVGRFSRQSHRLPRR